MLIMAYGMTHEEGAVLGLTSTVPEKQMEGTAGGKKCMVGNNVLDGSPSIVWHISQRIISIVLRFWRCIKLLANRLYLSSLEILDRH